MILSQLGRSENMRLPEDYEEQNNGKPVVYMFAGVCTFIVLLFAVMLFINLEPKKMSNNGTDDKNSVVSSETANANDNSNSSKSDLVSEDLDFWGMYPEDNESEDIDDEVALLHELKEIIRKHKLMG